MSASLMILAGGKSRRMRAEKASLAIPGGTLIGRVLRSPKSLTLF
jgi:molybdopterin-guanine dinucleotide biosynthesis protein A